MSSSDQIPVPSTTEEVTPEWISLILGTQINRKDFKLTENAHEGIGWLSNLLRIHCRSAEDPQKEFNLIVKLLPMSEFMRELVCRDGFDKTEIGFYAKIAPDLIEAIPDIKVQLCPTIYSKIQAEDQGSGIPYASVLVLEDLKPLNYIMIPFGEILEDAQIKETLDFMAKVHYGGLKIQVNKGMGIPKLYPFLQGIEENPDTLFFEMARTSFDKVDALLATHGTETLRNSIKSLAPFAEDVIKLVVFQRNAGESTLVHGDLWSNNIMFNKDPSISSKYIDWQLAGYADQALDVAVVILSSLAKGDLTQENVNKYLTYYHASFLKYCRDGGISHEVKRSWEEFKAFFESYALCYGFLWFSMSIEPFEADYPRLVNVFEYLIETCKIHEFLLGQFKLNEKK